MPCVCLFLAIQTVFFASGVERIALADPARMAAVKAAARAGDPRYAPALDALRKEADAALTAGPFSLVDKPMMPPSGDKHDYMSVGPYWWPNPETEDGLPYVRHDGKVNPERQNYDNVPLGEMIDAVETLALAHYFVDEEKYATHAALLLRTWFLDDATRMNPHLRFGQAIPGRCDGRGVGIIDTTGLAGLLDAVCLLQDSEAWTEADQKGIEGWFGEYLEWLLTSDLGLDEARAKNNHGTWYDVQVAAFARFVGRDDVVQQVFGESAKERLASQIEPDGRQPGELARTKSYSYSLMNLRGFFYLAAMAEKDGIDLWNYHTEDGRSLRGALDWIIAEVQQEKGWPHPQLGEARPQALIPLLRMAAIAFNEPRYEALVGKYADDSFAADRLNLLFPPLVFEQALRRSG